MPGPIRMSGTLKSAGRRNVFAAVARGKSAMLCAGIDGASLSDRLARERGSCEAECEAMKPLSCVEHTPCRRRPPGNSAVRLSIHKRA